MEHLLISFISSKNINLFSGMVWQGEKSDIHFTGDKIQHALQNIEQEAWAVDDQGSIGITFAGNIIPGVSGLKILGLAPAIPLEALGDENFRKTYRTQFAYYAGAMANGISSENLVISLGRKGFLGSYGAGGLPLERVESAIMEIKEALPKGPYAFNLLNSPNEPMLEQRLVDLYLKHQMQVIEASAYLVVTPPMVQYRASGLSRDTNGDTIIGNRIIAKLSRLELAQKFLEPAPVDILTQLVEEKKITPLQAELARQVPMADDITVEADSGGHTDNRPLVCMLPAFTALRDELQNKYQYPQPVRIGSAGGIGTPGAALAAFMLGAAYIVTGSVNQACVESSASEYTRKILAQMEMADVAMAPAGDMFEMGSRVQVLKRGTMFAMRAQKLYDLYTRYNAWEEIPQLEREKLEKTVFKRDFNSIWGDTEQFFAERDPRQIERANTNPKDKMALVFRWYLGLSSRWSIRSEKGRELDYQVWTGPSMGAFNNWVKGTYLETPSNRHVVDVAEHILRGCAYLYRVRSLEMQGVHLPGSIQRYVPEPLSSG
jgi:trans-AT polyketide synthase/acyltransferase/oxidoreductase domain-containing protein